MRQIDLYVVELPIIVQKNGNRKQPTVKQNGLYFMHGNGCQDWDNCLNCPKRDCDWQPYPKAKRRKTNAGT